MKNGKATIIIIILLLVLIAGIVGITYNSMLTKSETMTNSLSNLNVMLQRRADLIPNLVNTVKGYTTHEAAIIKSITDARTKFLGASDLSSKAKANTELSNSLSALMVVVENYPDLKSSENFIQLADELAGSENRVAVARKDYNDSVKIYNLSIKRLPGNLLAPMFGFKPASYFEADATSQEVPNVNFN